MNGRTALALAIASIAVFVSHLEAQRIIQLGANGEVGERERNTPARPTPRRTDGRVDLGPFPNERGMWLPFNGINERLVLADDAAAEEGKPKLSGMPFQPWARQLFEYRQGNQFEPHVRCKPSGGPRQFLTPYGVEFIDVPDLQRIFILDLGGPHTYRTIYMDRKTHPRDLVPSYYGHSIGRWEGDTLVVDSVGFNEAFWFDRSGLPHTAQLHMIERFTRADSKTMKYEVFVEDPGAYTAPWRSHFLLGWDPGQELFEYVCQDNNLASDLLVGSQDSIDRSSSIVP